MTFYWLSSVGLPPAQAASSSSPLLSSACQFPPHSYRQPLALINTNHCVTAHARLLSFTSIRPLFQQVAGYLRQRLPGTSGSGTAEDPEEALGPLAQGSPESRNKRGLAPVLGGWALWVFPAVLGSSARAHPCPKTPGLLRRRPPRRGKEPPVVLAPVSSVETPFLTLPQLPPPPHGWLLHTRIQTRLGGKQASPLDSGSGTFLWNVAALHTLPHSEATSLDV